MRQIVFNSTSKFYPLKVKPMSNNPESIASQSNSNKGVPQGIRLVKRLSIGAFMVTAIYFLFYGPVVMNGIDRYGKGADVLRTVYNPAHLLANNNEIYGDYRYFWIKRSSNYHWWLRQNSAETENVFHPPRQRNFLNVKNRYQPPPIAE